MLSHVIAVRFDGRVQSGRTVPCRLTCEATDGTDVEVVAKLSDGCDRKVTALVIEAIADAVADLGQPEEIGRVFARFQKYLYQPQI